MRKTYAIATVLMMIVCSLCIFSGSSEAAPSFAYVNIKMEDGTPVSGANVTLTNTETGISIYGLSDENGDCTFQRDVESFVLPGFQFAAYNQTITVDVTKGKYTGHDSFYYSWVPPTMISKEWVNITLKTSETEPIPFTTLLSIGIGIGVVTITVIAIFYLKSKEEKEKVAKKGDKKGRRR